jgi:hypothetical protein
MKIKNTKRYELSGMEIGFDRRVSVEEATRHVGKHYTSLTGKPADIKDTVGMIRSRDGGRTATWGIYDPTGGSPLFYLSGPSKRQKEHIVTQYFATPEETATLFGALQRESETAPQDKGLGNLVGSCLALLKRHV